MKIRVKFSKMHHMKFVGHLDIMRYFQRAIRRSGLPIKYSEGFSPHQIMSFAAPLGMGIESLGEYMDIELIDAELSGFSSKLGQKLLNAQMCEGMEILSFLSLEDGTKNAMSMVDAASYILIANSLTEKDSLEAAVAKLMSMDELVLSVEQKKRGEVSVKEKEIRASIRKLSVGSFEGELCLNMLLSHGSENNVKPELLIRALEKYSDLHIAKYRLIRKDIFSKDERSLESYGKEIK